MAPAGVVPLKFVDEGVLSDTVRATDAEQKGVATRNHQHTGSIVPRRYIIPQAKRAVGLRGFAVACGVAPQFSKCGSERSAVVDTDWWAGDV